MTMEWKKGDPYLGMQWTMNIPKVPGCYLRVNAGHQVSMHHVRKQGRWLTINWGWGGEGGTLRSCQARWKGKLAGWQWYGPIPEPDLYADEDERIARSNR